MGLVQCLKRVLLRLLTQRSLISDHTDWSHHRKRSMEELKAAVPENLKRMIGESSVDDLPSTSSSVLHFFHYLPLFHQFVCELTDVERGLGRKNEKAALESKLKGNDCFSRGDFSEAVRFYTKALRWAPTDVEGKGKDAVPVLYVNRAFAFYKMGLLVESVRDSSRALSVSPGYAKAWFRRGKANASLRNYHDAIQDFSISMKLELSLSGQRQIENEMMIISDHYKETSCLLQNPKQCRSYICDEPCQIELKCVSTRTKGRGMITLADIPEACLVHKEDPYAAIILKECRQTHCHFCFNELPLDPVPCKSCYFPLYCSQLCQVQAGGEKPLETAMNTSPINNLSDNLKNYISGVISVEISRSHIKKFTEHVHECEGVHWPVVLPSDIVLASRVLVKYIEQQRHSGLTFNLPGLWDLCHNYTELPPECKLESHIYSVILINCLQHSCGSELPINGSTVSQLVVLLSQVRVNSMAIICMGSFEVNPSGSQQPELPQAASTTALNQIRVGQAVYSAGSLFNHSCQPNIHAYFVCRTLCVRATEFVTRGCELELSYGAQVGQQSYKDRKQFLEDRYSFGCECRGCSQLNLSDLVLNGYRCAKMNCFGAVLDCDVVKYEKQKLHRFIGHPRIIDSNLLNQGDKCYIDDIRKVAHKVLEDIHLFKPQYCLNCNAARDLEVSHSAIREAEIHLRRLQDAVASNDVSTNLLLDALKSVDLLRETFHPLNKRLAEAEDCLAQAFCMVGELQAAVNHCRRSIEILEKLYGAEHIAIGNELLKLTSIQLSLRDCTAADSLDRVVAIFSRYYGSHASSLFPLLQHLKEETLKIRS